MNCDVEIQQGIKNRDSLYHNCPIFKSKEEMTNNFNHFCYGDCYILGRLWINSMRHIMFGTPMNLIPKIYAAKDEENVLEKFTCVPLRELPIYDDKFSKEKDFLDCPLDCPGADVNYLKEAIIPYVAIVRPKVWENVLYARDNLKYAYNGIIDGYFGAYDGLKRYWRQPEQKQNAQGMVILGSLAGFLLAVKHKKGLPTKLFYAALGGCAVGSVCFPKETDEAVRNFSYGVANILIKFYNIGCRKNVGMHVPLKCAKDFPPDLPDGKISNLQQCQRDKEDNLVMMAKK